MIKENIFVDLLKDNRTIIKAEMAVYEESPYNEANVLIEIRYNKKTISKESEYFFSALQDVRKELEQENIIILCNGAARNVYPSPMQMSFGGSKAYILRRGCPTRLVDVVDIFERNDALIFTSVEEQSKYYDDWLRSI